MSLVPFGTRLPESKRNYIRYKAFVTGKEIQEIMVEIIDSYQKNDTECMKNFNALHQPSDSTKNSAEGVSDDA